MVTGIGAPAIFLEHISNPFVRELVHYIAGVVSGTVVYDNYFVIGVGLIEHALYASLSIEARLYVGIITLTVGISRP